MSIWGYLDPVKNDEALKCAAKVECCPFCTGALASLDVPEYLPRSEPEYEKHSYYTASGCETCGWWRIVRESRSAYLHSVFDDIDAAAGSLKRLDVSDIAAPVQEVRNYLVARYDSRYEVHPRLFEETVASVFRDMGYRARVTGYSNDGGVDVILDSPSSELIGVQVKRYRNSIKVESIRSLAGALVLNGCTEGVFVTTSDFQSGCEKAAGLFAVRGIPIRLLNATKFYDALSLVERSLRSTRHDWLPAVSNDMFLNIDHDEFGRP